MKVIRAIYENKIATVKVENKRSEQGGVLS